MSGDIGDLAHGAGDFGTGVVVANAVEPAAGAVVAVDGHTRERACLNCGAELVGPHCHGCGQRAHVHRTITAFIHDLLHGVLHFEGKAWRTLPMLLFRPGRLTREYIGGMRARHISPIALFLFMVLLAFATVSVAGGVDFGGLEANSDIDLQIAKAENRLERLRAEQAAAPEPAATIDRKVAETQKELALLRDIKREGLARAIAGQAEDNANRVPPDADPPTAADARSPPLPDAGNALDRAWKKAKENPQLLAYKLQNTAYKFGWLLIPISVPFVWLLFPFSKRYRFYDHTVFVTYSLCFALLLVATTVALGSVGAASIAAPFLLIALLVHMGAQLKGAYQLGWTGTLVRLPLLYIFSGLSLLLFALITIALGAL